MISTPSSASPTSRPLTALSSCHGGLFARRIHWTCARISAALLATLLGTTLVACGPSSGSLDGGAAAVGAEVSASVAADSAAAPDEIQAQEPTACVDHSKLDPTTLPALPETPYTATFEAVWRMVLEKHFDPTLACQDWPALRVELGAKLVDAKDPAAAYAIMNELLDRLGQSHFRVIPPSANTDAEAGPRGSAQAPLSARWIDEELVVVDGAVGGVDSGIPRGAVLLEIGDHKLGELTARIKARTERPSELAFELTRGVANLLSGEDGEQRSVRFRDPAKDQEQTREVTCVTPTGDLISLGNLRNIPTTVEGRMIAGTKTGYLAFNYWMLPMINKVETTMAELRAEGMESLIIDLRGNPGGVGAMSVPLARMLLREDGSLGTLQFRDFKQEFKVTGNPDAFAGPVVLLIDEGTASTSEIFATGMRDLGRLQGIVGGRASAGAALPSLIESLESGAILQYVVGDYHSSKGTVAEGDGVLPDVLVQEHRQDFAAGRDPVLDAALRSLSNPAVGD